MNPRESLVTFQFWIGEHQLLVQKFIIVLGLLAFVTLLPFTPFFRFAIFLAVLPVAIVGILILLRWPSLAPIIIVISSLIAPIEIGTGSGSSVNAPMLAIMGLVGIWLFDIFAFQKPIYIVRSPTLRPLTIFILLVLLSFAFGQLPWFTFGQAAPLTAQIGGVMVFILSALGYLLVGQQINDIVWLKHMVWAFIIVGTISISGLVLPSAAGRLISKVVQYGIYNGSLFWTWYVALAFGQALFNNKLNWFWRVALFAGVLLALYTSLYKNYDWKSGWVPPLVVIGILLCLKSRYILLSAIIGGVSAVPSLIGHLISSDQYSYSTRIDAWIIVLEIANANLFFGLGPANYYWYTPLFPIRGYAVQFNSHSQYVDLIAQLGIVGTLSFFWLMLSIGLLAWRLRTKVPEGFAQAYVYCALAGLGGMVVAGALGDWLLPFVYNVGFNGFRASILGWLFLGGLVTLEKLYHFKAD